MPQLDDVRVRVLEALNTALASCVRDDPNYMGRAWRRHDRHRYSASCALCCGEADTLADAVVAALDECVRPALVDFGAVNWDAERVAEWTRVFREAVRGSATVLPPGPFVVWRSSPEARRKYLTEHRAEAVENGIPELLVDRMIQEALEAGDAA